MNNETSRRARMGNSEIKNLFLIAYRHALLISIFVACAGFGGYLHFKFFPKYKASSSLYVQSSSASPMMSIISNVASQPQGFGGDTNHTDKYLKIIRSKVFTDFLLKQSIEKPGYFDEVKKQLGYGHDGRKFFKGMNLIGETMSDKDLVSYLLEHASFKKTDYDVISVEAVTRNAKTASVIANFLILEAKRAIVSFESKEIEDAEQYLNSEISLSRGRLKDIYQSLKRIEDRVFREKVANRNKGESSERVVERLEEELEMAQIRLSQNTLLTQNLTKAVKAQMDEGTKRKPTEVHPVDLSSGRGRILDKLRALAEERKVIMSNMDALKNRLLTIRPRSTAEIGQRSFEFEKKLEVEHDLQKMLWRNLFDAKVQKITIENRIRIHGLASKSGGHRKVSLGARLLFSMVAAALLMGFGIFTWEHLHPVVTSREQLVDLGLTYLGSIPVVGQTNKKLKNLIKGEAVEPQSPLFERDNYTEGALAFDYIRARLEKVMNGRPKRTGHVICVVSAMASEGKSVVASNLAQSFAKTGRKTLLLDFDFRKGTLRGIFDLNQHAGIADFLKGGLKLKEVLRKDIRPNLDFIEAGNLDLPKSEVVSEVRVKEFLEYVSAGYDAVIADTPSFLSGPDGLMLAESSDIPLMVVNSSRTRVQEAADVVETFHAHSSNSMYVVLNRLKLPFARNPYRSYVIPEGEAYTSHIIEKAG